MKSPRLTALLAALLLLLFAAGNVFAAGGYAAWTQNFNADTTGWLEGLAFGPTDDYGAITQVPSGAGTLGVTSASGTGHAEVSGINGESGPFSRFDGYRRVWPGEWIAEIDVYLDPVNWPANSGFDYSVAATGTNGAHRRDFIFHVAKYTNAPGNRIVIAGSNNSNNSSPRTDLESINHYTVNSAGWYTLQHRFYEVGGVLRVDLNLLDASNAILFTETRSDPSDLVPSVVGGNRYAWFTFIDGGPFAVDNHELTITSGWEIVRRSNVNVDWFLADTRAGGDVNFVYGLAPSGTGSLEITTNSAPGGADDSIAKAQFFTTDYIGTLLADIDALSYFAYRSSTSTSPLSQNVALNLQVDYLGNGSSFTTLVWESVYQPGGVGAMALDTWQRWDAISGGNGIWWSTQAIPGVCNFTCYVTWDTIVTNNPNAKIIGGMGFNVGSGLDGLFLGNADALTVGVNGVSTVYDFEPPTLQKVVITPADLETSTNLVTAASRNHWFFYNDENDTINNALGTFIGGPGTTPEGLGSVQISVSGAQRRNLATYQFRGTVLANINVLAFSTYNPSAGNPGSPNRSGYLHFNVDFNGSDSWQRRLIFLPSDNGTVVQNSWQEWDAINNGNALWRYSGPTWPITGEPGSTTKTWSQILSQYPGVRMRVTDSFLGIRVGEPYNDGYTENIDAFKFGVGDNTTVFDFEPRALQVKDAAINMHGQSTFEVPVLLDSGANNLSSVGFTVAWNQACLVFDSITDSNNDGIPNSITGLPADADFDVSITRNGTDQEVTILITPDVSAPPLPLLSDGTLATLQFDIGTCDSTPGSTPPLSVVFFFPTATTPSVLPSFGNDQGQSVDGATDGGIVTLTFNATPGDIELDDSSVAENEPAGTQVGTLCTDDDTPDGTDCAGGPGVFTYSLVSSGAGCSDSSGNFAFQIGGANGNQLRTQGALNHETNPSYSVCIQSTDAHGLSLIETFVIAVTNVNEAPTDIYLDSTDVDENAASAPVGTLSTIDEDAGGGHVYTECPSSPSAEFEISGNILQTSAALNAEAQSSYNVCIRSTDLGGLFVERTFTITVDDVNDAPVAVNDFTATAPLVVVGDGTAVTIDVLANDTDQDGDPLSINAIVDNVDHGTTAIAANKVNYTAASNFNGPDSFTYTAKDPDNAVSNVATVSLAVVANNQRADCNADGKIDAADFPATVLEIFDTDSGIGWWLTYTGAFPGSPLGCDSNNSKNGLTGTVPSVDAADIICTVLIFFGDNSCAAAVSVAAAAESGAMIIPSELVGAAGETVAVPVTLETGGNNVAAATFALSFDGAAASFDPTDNDGDGVPDAVTLNVPANMAKTVIFDADANRIQVALYGTSLPMPLLSDGVLATIELQVTGGASALSLTQASLGSDAGQSIPVDGSATPTQGSGALFLPLLSQK